MFFALTEDQREFDTAVRSYLAQRFDLSAVREVFEDTEGDGHPASLWKAAGEQGWLAVLVPEAYDGLGLGMVEAQVIARALGAGVAPGPWRGTVLAGAVIAAAGSDEQRATWLPRIAAGEVVGALAPRGSAPGTLTAVEYGGVADVVVARSDTGMVLVEGGQATARGGYDRTVRLADLDVAAGTALPGATPEVLGAVSEQAAVLVAADLVGIARESLTRTVEYDKQREQFGVPVGSFQAIKHALADLHVAVTLAEHAVLYAAHAVDADLPDRELAVSVAKAKASDTALAATAGMIQYHGGIGYTWEHDAHFYYKRAKRLAAQWGDADTHRERIAALTLV